MVVEGCVALNGAELAAVGKELRMESRSWLGGLMAVGVEEEKRQGERGKGIKTKARGIPKGRGRR